jgi:hypothetical protein
MKLQPVVEQTQLTLHLHKGCQPRQTMRDDRAVIVKLQEEVVVRAAQVRRAQEAEDVNFFSQIVVT